VTILGAGGPERIGVIIVAAGLSRRMGAIDKAFTSVLGRPLLAWAVDPFEHSPVVDEIVLAVHRQKVQQGRALVFEQGWKKVTQVCRGGERRQDSVREALLRLQKCDWVAVHDGARPCVPPQLLLQGIEAAKETGAAVPGVSLTDTIKRVDDTGLVEGTVDRGGLWAIQTPQVFRYAILWAAYQSMGAEATDDAVLVEQTGHRVRVFPGDRDNIKVTVAQDLPVVTALLQRMQVEHWPEHKSESTLATSPAL